MSQVKFCRSSKVIGLLALCAFLALPVGLLAQVTGSISGFITDPTGAAVPAAKVTATLVSQNFSINTTSNDQGFYQFTAVQPGTYTVVLEKSGFQRLTHTNVVVTVSQPVRLDLLLTLGQVTQSVEVSAAPTLVNTTSGTTSGLIDDSRVVDLPLNGRNVVSLAITVPGVLNVTAPQNLTDARSGPQMDVGSRSNMNMFTLNGAYFNQPSRNTGMNPPPPDAVQEFRIQTSDFDAEYGHDAGSQVTIVTKSGTNQYHGDAFEFLRNDALNARNFFSATRPTLKENQFGGAGGGPIWKSKHLFGFGSYQGLRILPQAQAIVAHVPSAAERDGDFSALPAGSLVDPIDPLTGQGLVDSSGNPCVQKDSGGNFTNIINPNCISPVSKNLLQYVPQSPSGTIIALGSQPQNENEALARIDWNQSSKHSLFGTFFYDKNNLVSPFYNGGNILGYDGTSEVEETDEWSLNDTYTFSPTLLNQLVGSFLRTTSNQINSRTIVPSDLGIQNFPQYAPTGIVGVNVGGLFDLGSGSSTRFINNNWQAGRSDEDCGQPHHKVWRGRAPPPFHSAIS